MSKTKPRRKAVTLLTRLSAVECSQEAITEALTATDVALARVFYRLGVAEGLERRLVHLETILADRPANAELKAVVLDLQLERMERQIEGLIAHANLTPFNRLSAWCKQAWATFAAVFTAYDSRRASE